MSRRIIFCILSFCTSALVFTDHAARAENWPQYRGPTGQGQTADSGLPTTWGGKENENILWKSPLPHTAINAKPDLNQSSPIAWGDRIYVATCSWPDKATQKDFPDQHVTCYAAASGKQLWDVLVPPGPWLLTDLRGGYGASTPCTDGERLYVAFGSATIAALNCADGKLLWHHEFANYKDIDVCFASSPILYQDNVLLLCDKNNKASTFTAFDRKSGDQKWEQKRPALAFDHTTPVLIKVKGQTQMLIAASNALQAADPASGEILWSYPAKGDVPSPVYDGKLVYTDSGRGGPGFAVDPTGSGDMPASNSKWKIANIPEGLSSPVISGEWLYRMHNPGIVRCINMTTGEEAYSQRLDGASAQASPFATPDGFVYFASAGKSYVLKAGPKYEVVATNDLNDGSSASAAVSNGKIYLKGRANLWCVGKK